MYEEYWGSEEQEFWEKPKPARPTENCDLCARVYPNMLVKWPTGEVTRHIVKHYHPMVGQLIIDQRPIEGRSRWCAHTYPLHFYKSEGYSWHPLLNNDLTVHIIAGDQEFSRVDL